MRRMRCPTHPGEILKEDVLPELGITITEAASQLGVTRVALSRVINGKTGISPDMALRLAAWLGNSPEIWINMQSAYDLYQASQKKQPNFVSFMQNSPLKHEDMDIERNHSPARDIVL